MHLTRASRLGAAASAVLACSLATVPKGAAAADPPPVRLQGVVTDADTCEPVPGACVEILHASYLQRIAEVCADADGHYALQGWMLANGVSVFTRAHANRPAWRELPARRTRAGRGPRPAPAGSAAPADRRGPDRGAVRGPPHRGDRHPESRSLTRSTKDHVPPTGTIAS